MHELAQPQCAVVTPFALVAVLGLFCEVLGGAGADAELSGK